MALIGPFEKNEQTYPSCYVKLLYVQGDSATVSLLVNYYSDEDHRKEDYGHPIHQAIFTMPAEDYNGPFMATGYDHLKGLEDFAGWVDG